MITAPEAARRALKSWIAVEVFSPKTVKSWNSFVEDKLSGASRKLAADRTAYRWSKPPVSDRAPWYGAASRFVATEGSGQSEVGASGKHPKDWYIVVLGAIPAKEAFAQLEIAFKGQGGDDEEEGGSPPSGFIQGATITLNEEGISTTIVPIFASFAWGLGRVMVDGSNVDFSRWSHVEQSLQEKYKDKIAPLDAAGRRRPLEWADLYEVSASLAGDFGLTENLWLPLPMILRVTSKFAPEPDLLSGFYLNDLSRVLDEFSNLPRTAAQYLQLLPPRQVWDPLSSKENLNAILRPYRFPLARWPGPGLHPLTLLQQVAVNHIVSDLEKGGLAGVNGPPGTGKTTLIRDIVAHVLEIRAETLAAIENPWDARNLKGLLDFGIVIASSNNAAVENVSMELPVREKAMDASIWRDGKLDHFSETASHVLNLPPETAEEQKAWGLISARLGNMRNVSDFVYKFWDDQTWGIQGWLWDAGFPVKPGSKRPPRGDWHKAYPPPKPEEARAAWPAAQAAFTRARKKALDLRQALSDYAIDLDAHKTLTVQYRKGKSEVDRLERQTVFERGDVRTLFEAVDGLSSSLKAEKSSAALILSTKPAFWHRWFNTADWKAFVVRMDGRQQKLDRVEAHLKSARGGYSEAVKTLNSGEADLIKAKASLDEIIRAGRALQARLEGVRQRWGQTLPAHDFWESEHEHFHRSSPWNGGAFMAARDELFVASIRLHQAFIAAAAKPIKNALDKVIAELRGSAQADQRPTADDWGLFFVMVPVISSAFASCSRMLRSISAGQLGWLIVDEAGQANPQYAMGAIWRSKRVAIIGDPLQIEPVTSLPKFFTAQLFRNNGIEPDGWAAPKDSAQTLADRASPVQGRFQAEYGGDSEGCRITGLPLLVHRRCEEPMFSISNRIAYADQMVHATPPGHSPIGQLLGESAWINIEGQSEDKWVASEGMLINEVLTLLFQRLGKAPDIYVICPFRSPARRLRDLIWSNRAILPGISKEKRGMWINDHVGTVHTFQGKEAEAVILMLGAGRDANKKSRDWAGSTPNILNVAATRAKRRLYLLGDRSLWGGVGVFQEATRVLPVVEADDWRRQLALPSKRVGNE